MRRVLCTGYRLPTTVGPQPPGPARLRALVEWALNPAERTPHARIETQPGGIRELLSGLLSPTAMSPVASTNVFILCGVAWT